MVGMSRWLSGKESTCSGWKKKVLMLPVGLPQWFSGKEPAYSVGDARDEGSIPGLGRSPGGGHGNPLQYSCLENAMDRGT